MKKTFSLLPLTVLLMFVVNQNICYSQDKKDNYYDFEVGNAGFTYKDFLYSADQVYLNNGKLYIPERNKKSMEFFINIYSLETKQLVNKFIPSSDCKSVPHFTIENNHIFYLSDSTLTKVNMDDNKTIWSIKTGSIGYQTEPVILGDNIGVLNSRSVLVVNKENGESSFQKEEKNINGNDIVFFENNLLLYSKHIMNGSSIEGHTIFVYDIVNKKELYSFESKSSAKQVTFDGENFVFFDGNYVRKINALTGEEIWNWENTKSADWWLNKPLIINDKIYCLDISNGLYVINKENGQLIENLGKFTYRSLIYEDYLLICGVESMYAYNTQKNEVKKIAEYPKVEVTPQTVLYENYLVVHNHTAQVNKSKLKVLLFDLNEILKN